MGEEEKKQTLLEQGRFHYRQGSFDKALACLHRANDQYESENDRAGIAQTTNDIGVVYTILEKWDQAGKWLNEAHRLFVEIKDCGGEAQALGNLGSMFRAKGDLKQAAANLQLAADRFQITPDHEHRAATLRVLSMVRLRQFRFVQAIAAYDAALACVPNPTPFQKFLRFLFSLPLRVVRQ